MPCSGAKLPVVASTPSYRRKLSLSPSCDTDRYEMPYSDGRLLLVSVGGRRNSKRGTLGRDDPFSLVSKVVGVFGEYRRRYREYMSLKVSTMVLARPEGLGVYD